MVTAPAPLPMLIPPVPIVHVCVDPVFAEMVVLPVLTNCTPVTDLALPILLMVPPFTPVLLNTAVSFTPGVVAGDQFEAVP